MKLIRVSRRPGETKNVYICLPTKQEYAALVRAMIAMYAANPSPDKLRNLRLLDVGLSRGKPLSEAVLSIFLSNYEALTGGPLGVVRRGRVGFSPISINKEPGRVDNMGQRRVRGEDGNGWKPNGDRKKQSEKRSAFVRECIAGEIASLSDSDRDQVEAIRQGPEFQNELERLRRRVSELQDQLATSESQRLAEVEARLGRLEGETESVELEPVWVWQ